MLTRQDGDEEDDEDAVLEGGDRVVEVEELRKRFGSSQSPHLGHRMYLEGTHGQTDDEGDGDVLEETSEAVVGRTPESEEGTGDDDLELNPERRRVCIVYRSVICASVKADAGPEALKRTSLLERRVRLLRHGQSFGVELLDGFLDAHKLLGLEPDVGPVLVANATTGTGTDGLELWVANRKQSVSSLP